MSVHTLELVLHDLGVKRDARKAFKENPDTFLAHYAELAPDEREMVRAFDVKGLLERGANPMLTMGYWIMNEESRSVGRYLKRANGAE